MTGKNEQKKLYMREYMQRRRHSSAAQSVSQLTQSGSNEARGPDLQGGFLATRSLKKMERETGFEPATSYLEGRHSATELLPLAVDRVNSIFYPLSSMTVNVDI